MLITLGGQGVKNETSELVYKEMYNSKKGEQPIRNQE